MQTECLKLSFSGDNTIHKYPCYKVGLEFGAHDTAQDVFRPIPGLISSAGVTGDGDCYIMHRMAGLIQKLVETP